MFEITKGFCDSFLEKGFPGFDLAVYQKGKEILRYHNGYSDIENRIPVNGSERYNIYSCSKPITCTAALQLWEKGVFSLEDRLSDYMPEFLEMTVRTENGLKKAEKPILIRHLFEMTAGFSYDVTSSEIQDCKRDTGGRCPTREVMKYLCRRPLLFEPGERWRYSLCHDVLAALVEVLSGEKFEDYVKENIFDVAGMQRSTFMLPDCETETLAQQYRFVDGKPVNIGKSLGPYKMGTEYASGGAGCISTVDDYMKFMEALRTFVLLKPETVKMMTTDTLTERQRAGVVVKRTHGYGLGVRCPKEGGFTRDYGWGGAAGAFLAIDPEREISLYLAAHMLSFPAQPLRYMIYPILDAELTDIGKLTRIKEYLRDVCAYDLKY